MNKILIDTNVYSSALRGEAAVVQILKRVAHIGISAVSLGELFSGFRGGKRERENREELAFFLDSPRVVLYGIDHDTAEYYCAVLDQLKKQGTPIPTNDIWIAATAFQHGLQLYTFDGHFTKIEGLLLQR